MDTAVVIPVGSIDAVFGEQVARVLSQSGVSLSEVVLSVNSADPAVVSEVRSVAAASGDPRLRIVDSSDHKGAAHARNVGAAATNCAAIGFCDADDLVHEGWLSGLVNGLDEFDAVSGDVVDVFADERMRHWYPAPTRGELNSFLGKPYLLTGNLAIRREAFEAVGGFDETLTRCEDIAISWSLVRAGYTIGHVGGAVIDYRHRAGVLAMLRQHYSYGRGMSEVLRTFGTPGTEGGVAASRFGMLRPNGQRTARRSATSVCRRTAIAAGRLRGLLR
ncbi:MAG: glycosyltransferase [Actinomycetia bacterium]|nr:glycosyltransferase [Actinomycetes bacterium]